MSASLFVLAVVVAAFAIAALTGHASAGALVVAVGLVVAAWDARRMGV